jgi:LCP family protein required for cell wall assembly
MSVDQQAPEHDAWGPTARGGGRRGGRRPGRTALLTILLVLLAFLLYVAGAAFYANARISRAPVDDLSPALRTPVHVLVVGSDSMEGLTPEQRRELSVGSEGLRADTLFILTIGVRGSAMLAIPRDLQVTRCDGSTGRINAAIGIGGPDCLVETVADLSGIPLSHYIELNFLGFVNIVDAVGGVEVCLEEPIADDDAGIDLPAGCQVLEGPDALGYVRVRKIDDDLQRIQRQQQFMNGLASELMSPGFVLNPARLYGTAGEIGAALTADERLGPFDLSRFGLGVVHMATGRTEAYTLPTTPSGNELVLEEAGARALFDDFRDGSILRAGGEEPVSRDEVELAVLNGTEVGGLAGRTAEGLEAEGYTVSSVGNAEPVERTTVLHPPGEEAAARLVARDLGGVSLAEDDSVQIVTVVVGPDLAEG